MTAIGKQPEPRPSFCHVAPSCSLIFVLVVIAFSSGSVSADDAEIGMLLRAKGVEVTEAKGIVTGLTVQDGSKLTDDDFRQMTQLGRLKTLSLSNGLDDGRLSRLTALAELEYLQTNLAEVSDEGVKPLAQLKKLKNLKFFHPGKSFSGTGLVHLAELPNLQSLTVAGSLEFNDEGMAAVAKLTGLQEFRTWHVGATDEGVKKLKALKNLKSLYLGQRLTYKLPACPTDETVGILVEMKSLESLQLDEARLTFAALQQLKHLPALKKVTLGGIDIPKEQVERLRRELPQVKINWTEPNEMYQRRIRALFGAREPGRDAERAERTPITGPLRASKNPTYFEDATGNPLILCGSHTWNTLQDWGTDGTLQPLDFDTFVQFLKAHGHNFTLLWYTELPRFRGLPSTEKSPPDFTVGPHPWTRTGPGQATDGGLKFDLTKLNQEYFDRLRARVKALYDAGVYVGVYLFTGEFQLRFRFRSDGYPFSGPNNVNGVDDGYRGGAAETGLASVTMTAPNAMTDLQDAYVKKVIDTLNDLPNVLWIVSEEAPTKSTWWNSHLISLVRAYEKGKRHQHPIGYATLGEKPMDAILYNSDADWVAPWAKVSPAKSCGTGKPTCKVNINDSDHSYFGMWNETPQSNRNYAWENFVNGNQVLFMDPYLVHYPREKRNLCLSPVNGIGSKPDPRWENFRNNLGYILKYSRKLNLVHVTPSPSLCSTRYCLAQTPAAGAEYLVYAPSGDTFTMDLSAMPDSRMLAVEWFNPATGEAIAQDPIKAGSSSQSFTPPFSGDAVLYLVDGRGRR